mmetsp:Transcript_6909/g.12587  ORF Transcript_6909/g.12587 Transcript_6909/m.12587 type:complete len:260 (-) Transcript_6909:17-796(-)
MRPPRERGESSLARARQTLGSMEFRFTPASAFYHQGSFEGSGRVVDDDGVTTEYLNGAFSSTSCEYRFQGRSFRISFSQVGDFAERPELVNLRLSFPQLPPLHVKSTLNMGIPGPVFYDHQLLGSVFVFHNVNLRNKPFVEIEIDQAYPPGVLPNFVGALGRIRRARYIKDGMDDLNVPYGDQRNKLTEYVLSATSMSPDFAAKWPELWSDAEKQVKSLLSSDKGLLKDDRLSKFITTMISGGDEDAALPVDNKAQLIV